MERIAEVQSVYPLEAELQAALETGAKSWEELRSGIQSSLAGMQYRLTSIGLLVSGRSAFKARAVAGLIGGTVVTIGGLRLWHGFLWGRPIGFLAFLVMIALTLMLWALARPFGRPREMLSWRTWSTRIAKPKRGTEMSSVWSAAVNSRSRSDCLECAR